MPKVTGSAEYEEKVVQKGRENLTKWEACRRAAVRLPCKKKTKTCVGRVPAQALIPHLAGKKKQASQREETVHKQTSRLSLAVVRYALYTRVFPL